MSLGAMRFPLTAVILAFLASAHVTPDAVAQQVVLRRPAITGGATTLPQLRSSSSQVSPSSRSSRVSPKRLTAYQLDAGDFLAIVVDGVVGSLHEAKVHMPKPGDGTLPAIGTPVLILSDGTLGLPQIDPVNVRGMTVRGAKSAIETAYRNVDMIARDNVVMVSLLRKRTIDVTVLHRQPEQVYVDKVRLEAATASPLVALAESSGFDPRGRVSVVGKHVGQKMTSGDVVQVESAPRGFFYAGGNLNAGQYDFPNDRNVNALQAVAIAGGTRNSRPLDPLNVTISSPTRGTVTVPYRWLLQNPAAYPIKRGDSVSLR